MTRSYRFGVFLPCLAFSVHVVSWIARAVCHVVCMRVMRVVACGVVCRSCLRVCVRRLRCDYVVGKHFCVG